MLRATSLMGACMLCCFALFASGARIAKRRSPAAQNASTGSDRACPGPLATGRISSTTHALPVEGSELTKMAFSSCYRPSYQNSNALWKDVRSFLPEVFVWLGDNMYHDGNNMERKRQAYNEAKDDKYYSAFGPPASPKIPVTGTWDDHDYAKNNDGKHFPCKRETQDEFVHHFSIPPTDPRHQDYAGDNQRDGIYSSVMYSKSSATPVPTSPPTPAPPTPQVPTCGGQNGARDGDACVFPFEYEGTSYTHCMSADHAQPWCYTTACGNDCHKTPWGNCDCDGSPSPTPPPPTQTCGGNGASEGAQCVFPFVYQGVSHMECIPDGHNQPWCYTAGDGSAWGNCECDAAAQAALAEESGNGVHLINVDTRYFRSPTFSTYGACEGAASEMLGEAQWAWLDAELARPSEVKVIASGIQVLPPLAPESGAGGASRPKSQYCAYDGAGQTFDSAIANMNETKKFGTYYETWAEIPLERERLLRKCQKAMNDGHAKAIIFISGDQHWGEIMAKVMPADPVYGPSQVFYEVTASGIDQSYNSAIVNDNRLQPNAGPEFNAVTTHTSANGRNGNCNGHHVCVARANYGQIEVDFTTDTVYLRLKTPHEADPTASEVKISLG